MARNWAGNLTYTGRVVTPASVAEVQELVAGAESLGIPFDEHVEIVRDALKPIASDLGLNP